MLVSGVLFLQRLFLFILICSVNGNVCQRPTTTDQLDSRDRGDVNLTILVEQGALQGRRVESAAGGFFYSFQGIPYAKPPVGPLRFKDAQIPNSWSGVRNASSEGNSCPQPRDPVDGNEDCLFVNVYTPLLPPVGNDPFPVMVWFHGGGYVFGNGDSNIYGPDYLVSENVIVVTVNYRLGVFGFLYLNEAAPGNVGLKDQVAALRWVQRNIAAFGGDPDKVTIFGQSAGGASVHHHMLSPLSRGVFHAAIAQSGNALNPWGIQTAPAETTRRLARAVNCSLGDDFAIVECLRSVDVATLVTAAFWNASIEENKDRILFYTFIPTVDLVVPGIETFLPASPKKLIAEGRYNPVPFLTGFANNESLLDYFFRNFSVEPIAQEVDRNWNTIILPELRLPRNGSRNQEALEALRRFYMDGQPLTNATVPGFLEMLTDISFGEGIYYTVHHMAMYNRAPIYLYSFTVDDILNAGKTEYNAPYLLGAAHGDDLGYLFRISYLPEAQVNSSAWMARARCVRLWTNFAKYRNPTPTDDPILRSKWEKYSPEKNFMEIASELRPGRRLNAQRVQFWSNFYETYST